MLDMNIKLGQNTNPIFFKLSYMFVNNNTHPELIKICFPCFSQYLKCPNGYVYETSQTPRL